MKNIYIIFSIVVLTTLFLMCNDNSTGPPNGNGPDTTSHNFDWDIDTIGTSGSILHDIQIISDNEFWVFGELHTKDTDRFDSTGIWIPPFNAAKWIEGNYSYYRFSFRDIGTDIPIIPIYSFIHNSDTAIWMAAGSIFYFNGFNSMISLSRLNYGSTIFTEIWQSSIGALWVGGTHGVLVHHDGTQWRDTPSITSSNINDIWGFNNTVRAVASNINSIGEQKIISISNGISLDSLNWPFQKDLSSIWFENPINFYVCGAGLYFFDGKEWFIIPGQKYFLNKIRGSDENNIFAVGAYGSCVHYNGSTWKNFENIYISGSLYGLDVTDTYMVAVGDVNNRGLIIIGRSSK